MLKPVILITVYRRYGQLQQAVRNIRAYAHEFSMNPDIVIVWAQPEPALDWFMDELKVNHVLKRDKLIYEGERGGTTYPESHNINIGLRFIKNTYGESCYVIVQAADIQVKPGTFKEIDFEMQRGTNLCVYHWTNSCVPVGCFCTNFFAISMNENYWVPLANYDDYDVLEWKWGKQLLGYTSYYNYKFTILNTEHFKHEHLPIIFPPAKHLAPLITNGYDKHNSTLCLNISGKLRWYRRLINIIKSFWRDEN